MMDGFKFFFFSVYFECSNINIEELLFAFFDIDFSVFISCLFLAFFLLRLLRVNSPSMAFYLPGLLLWPLFPILVNNSLPTDECNYILKSQMFNRNVSTTACNFLRLPKSCLLFLMELMRCSNGAGNEYMKTPKLHFPSLPCLVLQKS